MKQILLFTLLTILSTTLSAQTVVLDFESPATSTTFQYFGSSLEPELNNIIANPDPSGINTSGMVADHVKPEGSQPWAGAFSNPNPGVMVDLVANNQICIKVWFNEPGNLALKLENSTTGGPDWITQQDITEAQTWVEVCYDPNDPSIEAPNQPAIGNVYETVVVFFDFQDVPTADRTYYFDDLVLIAGAAEGDVTFSVDMNDYTASFTTVYLSGTFNDWSADGNPMEDPDGDGVWTTTVADIPVGPIEYKFQVDQWADDEKFNGYQTCTITDASGQFTNRYLVVTGDAELSTVCWASCYACGEAVNITIELGISDPADPEGLFIAGGGNFGNPGDFPLKDDDGDGIWTATFERQVGFSSFFTFTNGNCPDYSCKENIAGQDCADPNNYNDRFMGPVTQDTTIATCFEVCTDNTDDCSASGAANVTFQVDMNDYTGSFTTVYISGEFNSWSADGNPMEDPDGDGVWETALTLFPNTFEYKFQVDQWSDDEQFNDGDPCTVTDPSGQFVNRVIEVVGDETICYEWATCTECEATSTKDLTYDAGLFEVTPTVAEDVVRIEMNDMTEPVQLRVLNTAGITVSTYELDAGTSVFNITTGDLTAGMYFIHAQSGNRIATQKIVKLSR